MVHAARERALPRARVALRRCTFRSVAVAAAAARRCSGRRGRPRAPRTSASTTSRRRRRSSPRAASRTRAARCPTGCCRSPTTSGATSASGPSSALWRDAEARPSRCSSSTPASSTTARCAINVVDAQGRRSRSTFSPSQFDYGKNEFASQVPQDLGFAGFRLHYPIKTPKYHDEVIVFLGAQLLPRRRQATRCSALSARGLAIDTALSSGEEFPYFREFWLVTPAPGAKELTIYALLDSPSVTGAYRFVDHARRADDGRRRGARSSCAARSRSSASRRSPACSSTARTRCAHGRRLPSRGARLRRPAAQLRQRRVALAPARQPARAARERASSMRRTRAASA